MRNRTFLAFGFFSLAAVIAACSADGDSSDNAAPGSGASGPGSGAAGPGSGASGPGGSGGDGGGGPGSGAGPGSGGAGGNPPDACGTLTDQLLISEFATQPAPAEFVEIWNAGTSPVDLGTYYLSDNSVYHGIAAGMAWAPGGTPNTDFLLGFPAGTMIPAGGVLTIEMGDGFEATYGSCPDLTVRPGVSCGGAMVPQVVSPPNGGVGTSFGSLLSNGGEMLMLFCWGGGNRVYDMDYVNWDPDPDPNTHVDKSAIAPYTDDTPQAAQIAMVAPPPQQDMMGNPESAGRCDIMEDGEAAMNGNGLLGHDETSEDWSTTFRIFTTPSPGDVNTCP